MYELTSEGREYAPQSQLLEALLEGPKDAAELVSELEWPMETVREHLRHYIQEGFIRSIKGEAQRAPSDVMGEQDMARYLMGG